MTSAGGDTANAANAANAVHGLTGLPQEIAGFKLTEVLGQGGMGRVVKGYDPVLRRSVAIKMVECSEADEADFKELRYMFHREARATAALNHTNIVSILGYSGADAAQAYIVYEYINAPTLHEIQNQRGALPGSVVASIGYELCRALDCAHEQGILHRDLKPENVFYEPNGRIVLADFGIAKAMNDGSRLGHTVRFGQTSLYGTPCYLAPEQLRGVALSVATDLYALGALLYDALYNHEPFVGQNIEEVLLNVAAGRVAKPQEHSDAPLQLIDLVHDLMSVKPEDRPADVSVVAQRLRLILDTLGVSDPRLILARFAHQSNLFLTPLTSPESALVSLQSETQTDATYPLKYLQNERHTAGKTRRGKGRLRRVLFALFIGWVGLEVGIVIGLVLSTTPEYQSLKQQGEVAFAILRPLMGMENTTQGNLLEILKNGLKLGEVVNDERESNAKKEYQKQYKKQQSTRFNTDELKDVGGTGKSSLVHHPSQQKIPTFVIKSDQKTYRLPSQRLPSQSNTSPVSNIDNSAAVPTGDTSTAVPVTLLLDHKSSVWVDDRLVGSWSKTVILPLQNGEHTLKVVSEEGIWVRQVMLLPGTSPEFDLR